MNRFFINNNKNRKFLNTLLMLFLVLSVFFFTARNITLPNYDISILNDAFESVFENVDDYQYFRTIIIDNKLRRTEYIISKNNILDRVYINWKDDNGVFSLINYGSYE